MSAPERDDAGRWLPGRSGNPGGRPRNPWRLALEQAAQEVDARSGSTAFEEILRALADAARQGDAGAASILLDRLIPKGRGSDEPDAGADLDRILGRLPSYLRHALAAALEAADAGATTGEVAWAFETRVHLALDEATRARLYRAAIGGLEIQTDAQDFEARLATLTEDEIDALDEITTKLRAAPIKAKLERECF